MTTNKTTFVGAVVGNYGEGKTSFMIYLWHKCESDGIFAVPPYVWFDFHDNFRVIHSWTRYRIGRTNEKLAGKLDDIYRRYRDPSLEKIAEDSIQKTGGDYEATLKWYEEQFEQGILRIDFTEGDLLKFCSEISEIVSQADYKGFIVFNDELEFTVEAPANSLNKVAGILFKLGDSLINSQGNYGFFFGMARNFQSQIHAARSAVLDRLARQNVFVRLSELYGQDFPARLWERYVDYFGLGDMGDKVVAPETLEAIGQVCDSSRRDLGNGPRSVISAFNRMVFVHKNYEKQYSPLDFVGDCLDNEITLGTESSYTRLIKELLANKAIRGKYEDAIKLLAAYPRGCPQQIREKYGQNAEVENLVQKTGIGRTIFESGYGYALVNLQLEDIPQESVMDDMMRGFYSRYSASREDLWYAVAAFRDMIIPQIFTHQQGQSIEGWKWSPKWGENQGIYSIMLEGTFTAQYPKRTVSVTLVSDINRNIPERFIPSDVNFNFIFDLSALGNAANEPNTVKILADNGDDVSMVRFSINLLNQDHAIRLQLVSIPENEKTTTPLFSLALLAYMEDKELPQNERTQYDVLKQRLVRNIMVSIFNEDMLQIDSLDATLDNKGERLIPELFLLLCRRRFPHYHTLICQSQWKSKITQYSNLLKSKEIPLSIKRGIEPWQPSQDRRESRQIIATGLNVKASNLETWLNGLESL